MYAFDYLFYDEMAEELGDGPYTVADILDGTSFVNAPYVYDSVLNMVYREIDNTPDADPYGLNVGAVEAAMLIIFFVIIIAGGVFWCLAKRGDAKKAKENTEAPMSQMTNVSAHVTATSGSSVGGHT